MDTRCFTRRELRELTSSNKLSQDLQDYSNIGILCISDLMMLLEKEKNRQPNIDLGNYLDNVSSALTAGHIYIAELNEDNLSTLFDDDELWNEHFNKASNPYNLVRLATLLKRDESCFWSEKIYEEAINQ